MAQSSLLSGSQYSREPTALAGHDPMPDRIDASMQRVQSPNRESVLDRIPSHSQFEHLLSRNHSVLSAREFSDPTIFSARPQRTAIYAGSCGLGGHPLRLPRNLARVTRGLCRFRPLGEPKA
jgi:hypothetical protein